MRRQSASIANTRAELDVLESDDVRMHASRETGADLVAVLAVACVVSRLDVWDMRENETRRDQHVRR